MNELKLLPTVVVGVEVGVGVGVEVGVEVGAGVEAEEEGGGTDYCITPPFPYGAIYLVRTQK